MKKIAIYSLLCFVLFSSSCKKDKPGTTPEEQGDYFTCYVNGEYWEAYSDNLNPQANPAIYVQYNPANGLTNLQIHRDDQGQNQDIKIFVDSLLSIGVHEMLVLGHDQTGYYDYNTAACQKYYHDSLNPGLFNLTYWNQQEHRMKGTFSMTLRNPDCPDSLLYITNGKFSFHYY